MTSENSHSKSKRQDLVSKMHKTKGAEQPGTRLLFNLAHSNLDNGRVARKHSKTLFQRLAKYDVLQRERNDSPKTEKVDSNTSILLGTHPQSETPIYIRLSDLPRHLLIIGGSGVGKSNTNFHIVNELKRHSIPISMFDNKGNELGRLCNKNLDIPVATPSDEISNICEPVSPTNVHSYFTQLLNSLGFLNNTRIETRSKLVDLLHRIYLGHEDKSAPFISLNEFRSACEKYQTNYGVSLGSANHLMTTVSQLFGERSEIRRGPELEDKFPLVIRNWSELTVYEQQCVASIFLFRLITRTSLETAGTDELIGRALIFDEGRFVFGKECVQGNSTPFQVKLMAQARSYKIGAIIATQSITDILDTVAANSASILVLRQQSVVECKVCAKLLGLDDESSQALMNLQVGQAFLKTPAYNSPVLVKIPYVSIGKYLSLSEIETIQKPIFNTLHSEVTLSKHQREIKPINFNELFGVQTPIKSFGKQSSRSKTSSKPVGRKEEHATAIVEEWVRFLLVVSKEGVNGAVKTYAAANVSRRTGQKLKETLIQNQLIETYRVPSPSKRRPIEAMRLTKKGKEYLDRYERSR